MTIIQNARTSGGGYVAGVPTQAITVGPVETWKAEKVSIWHAGNHDNPFGQRLTALMISKRIPDASVPMSLLADHPERALPLLPARDWEGAKRRCTELVRAAAACLKAHRRRGEGQSDFWFKHKLTPLLALIS